MTLRVLLLEDDELVRQLFSRFLRLRGCVVEAVSTVSDALARIPTLDPQIVLSDVMLVGETGLDLFQQLDARLQAHTVFMTGYAGFAREGLVETGQPILYKPFTLDELWTVLLLVAAEE